MHASIPAWVPALFLLLLALGWRQSQARSVRPGALVAVALAMLGFSLIGVVGTFGPAPMALLGWAAGYALAALGGAGLVSRAGLAVAGSRVRVQGSWVPLMLMMGIFAARFALGFAAGVRAPVLHDPGFGAAMAGLLGLLSGGFGARALAVHRVARGA